MALLVFACLNLPRHEESILGSSSAGAVGLRASQTKDATFEMLWRQLYRAKRQVLARVIRTSSRDCFVSSRLPGKVASRPWPTNLHVAPRHAACWHVQDRSFRIGQTRVVEAGLEHGQRIGTGPWHIRTITNLRELMGITIWLLYTLHSYSRGLGSWQVYRLLGAGTIEDWAQRRTLGLFRIACFLHLSLLQSMLSYYLGYMD